MPLLLLVAAVVFCYNFKRYENRLIFKRRVLNLIIEVEDIFKKLKISGVKF